MSHPMPGNKVPDLELALVGGDSWRLGANPPKNGVSARFLGQSLSHAAGLSDIAVCHA